MLSTQHQYLVNAGCHGILCYEKAEWSEIKTIAEELGLRTNEMAQIYMDSVEEVNNIWDNVVGMNEGLVRCLLRS